MEEYEKIYRTKFENDIEPFEKHITSEEAKELINIDMKNLATNHFGQSYLNSATIAGLMRILIKKLRVKFNIKENSSTESNI